jgi:hypothetical protein
MKKSAQMRLARLLSLGRQFSGVIPVRSVTDRTWIFFEFDPEQSLWRAMPAGLAIMAVFNSPEQAFEAYKQAVPQCGWSYEAAAALLTEVPADLLIESNRAYDKHPLDEIIRRLSQGIPLIEYGTGPRIIDPISDPGK